MSTASPAIKPENLSTAPIKSPIAFGNHGVQLSSFEDAWRFATCVSNSGWAPKGMEKPESVLVALQHGAELGLPPMAALQNIAVINGRPGIYGDAALAVVRASGLLESYSEKEVGTRGKDDWGFSITAKRKDGETMTETFTVADAKTANLWGKQGPWSQYPKRMLKFRARGFLLRDAFGDVLKGLRTVEELNDIPVEKNVTPKRSMAEMIEAPAGEHVTDAQAEHVFTREDAEKELKDYILDTGVSEKALLRELTEAKVFENPNGLGLFEIPTNDLSAAASYVKAKAASTTKGGE